MPDDNVLSPEDFLRKGLTQIQALPLDIKATRETPAALKAELPATDPMDFLRAGMERLSSAPKPAEKRPEPTITANTDPLSFLHAGLSQLNRPPAAEAPRAPAAMMVDPQAENALAPWSDRIAQRFADAWKAPDEGTAGHVWGVINTPIVSEGDLEAWIGNPKDQFGSLFGGVVKGAYDLLAGLTSPLSLAFALGTLGAGSLAASGGEVLLRDVGKMGAGEIATVLKGSQLIAKARKLGGTAQEALMNMEVLGIDSKVVRQGLDILSKSGMTSHDLVRGGLIHTAGSAVLRNVGLSIPVAEKVAKGAQILLDEGFAAQNIYGAIAAFPSALDALKEGDTETAGRLITQAAGMAGFGLMGTKAALKEAGGLMEPLLANTGLRTKQVDTNILLSRQVGIADRQVLEAGRGHELWAERLRNDPEFQALLKQGDLQLIFNYIQAHLDPEVLKRNHDLVAKSAGRPERLVPVFDISHDIADVSRKRGGPPLNAEPTNRAPLFESEKYLGGATSPVFDSYADASGVKSDSNPYVRLSDDPVRSAKTTNNDGRTLMVQISSDLINRDVLPTAYYEQLGSGARPGYAQMQDFGAIPAWIGYTSHMLPDADLYVVRNTEQAIKFLNEAKYQNVLFSAQDVNKNIIKDIASRYSEKMHVGGPIDPKFFADNPNIHWYGNLESLAQDLGVDYKKGVNYRHFQGSDSIPQLSMSESREVIDQQVGEIAKMGSKLVYINDKTFGQATNYQQLSDIYARLKKENPSFMGFAVQTTAAQLGKIPTEWLAKSGIKYMELGIESYNDPILKAMHKPATEALIDKVVDKLRKNKIALIPNILIGYPGETAETYHHTMEFLRRNRDIISHANVYNLALYENAELGKKMIPASEGDFNENILEKTWHTDPNVVKTFAGDLYNLLQEQLGKTPDVLQALRPLNELTQTESRQLAPGHRMEVFLNVLSRLPSVQELKAAAEAGIGGKDWYDRSIQAFDAMRELAPGYFKPEDADRFTGVVASTSPQQTVPVNLREALTFWKEWNDNGRPMSEEKILKLQKRGKIRHLSNQPSKFPNLMKALRGEDFLPADKAKYFKVGSFAKDLSKFGNTGVFDSWMGIFFGVTEKEVATAPVYHAMAVQTRLAAKELGWSVKQVQAAIWSFTKTLAEASGWKGGGEYHQPTEVLDYLTKTDSGKYAKDFADIMYSDPEVRARLHGLGVNLNELDKRLAAIPRPEAPLKGPTETTASESLRRTAERIAKAQQRLEGFTDYSDYWPGERFDFNRDITIPGFYSPLERAVDQMPERIGSLSVANWLANHGVPKMELEDSGLLDFLKGEKQTLSRDAIKAWLKENTPIVTEKVLGEALDDREAALLTKLLAFEKTHALSKSEEAKLDELLSRSKQPQYSDWTKPLEVGRQPNSYRELVVHLRPQGRFSENYIGGHFSDIHNALGWLRFDDRVSEDGKRTMFLHEVQEGDAIKRLKEGEKGRTRPANEILQDKTEVRRNLDDLWGKMIDLAFPGISERDREGMSVMDAQRAADEWRSPEDQEKFKVLRDQYKRVQLQGEELDTQLRAVPKLPYGENWHHILLKRALRYAAEHGYDQVAWTTGEHQNQRWSLSSVVDHLVYDPKETELIGWKGKEEVFRKKVESGDLPEYVGKEAAQKLTEDSRKYMESKAYDRNQWSVEVDEDDGRYAIYDPNGEIMHDIGGDVMHFDSPDTAHHEIDNLIQEDEYKTPDAERGYPELKGKDLEVGGHGMKGFYGSVKENKLGMIGEFYKGYGKKWGVEVGTTTIPGGTETPARGWGNGRTPAKKSSTLEAVHKIDITPAMQADVMGAGQNIAKDLMTKGAETKPAPAAPAPEGAAPIRVNMKEKLGTMQGHLGNGEYATAAFFRNARGENTVMLTGSDLALFNEATNGSMSGSNAVYADSKFTKYYVRQFMMSGHPRLEQLGEMMLPAEETGTAVVAIPSQYPLQSVIHEHIHGIISREDAQLVANDIKNLPGYQEIVDHIAGLRGEEGRAYTPEKYVEELFPRLFSGQLFGQGLNEDHVLNIAWEALNTVGEKFDQKKYELVLGNLEPGFRDKLYGHQLRKTGRGLPEQLAARAEGRGATQVDLNERAAAGEQGSLQGGNAPPLSPGRASQDISTRKTSDKPGVIHDDVPKIEAGFTGGAVPVSTSYWVSPDGVITQVMGHSMAAPSLGSATLSELLERGFVRVVSTPEGELNFELRRSVARKALKYALGKLDFRPVSINIDESGANWADVTSHAFRSAGEVLRWASESKPVEEAGKAAPNPPPFSRDISTTPTGTDEARLHELAERGHIKEKYSEKEIDELLRSLDPRRLTPAHRRLAEEISNHFRGTLERAQEAGALDEGLEHYVTHMWQKDADNPAANRILAEARSGRYAVNTSMARRRVFEHAIEGQLLGRKLAVTDPIALAAHNGNTFDRVIAYRKFLAAIQDKNLRASDGRPMAALSGSGTIMQGPDGESEALLVHPDRVRSLKISDEQLLGLSKTGDLQRLIAEGLIIKYGSKELLDGKTTPLFAWATHDYKSVSHPAFEGWQFVGQDTNVLLRGDLKVHPEAYDYIKRQLETQSPIAQTLKPVFTAGREAKGILLSFDVFHLVQEGLRAIMTGISPFGVEKWDLRTNPLLGKLVEYGLTLRDYATRDSYQEGQMVGHSHLLSKVPVIGPASSWFQNFLFQKYLPGLKARAAEHLYERYKKLYPEYTREVEEEISIEGTKHTRVAKYNEYALQRAAKDTNMRFGSLNLRREGRALATQDVFRLVALAPDWLESELRSFSLAMGGDGRVMRRDLAKVTVGLWLAARVLNMLNTKGANAHYEAPFGVAYTDDEGREKIVSLRTLPTDMLHAISDPLKFMRYRTSPLARTFSTVYTGRDSQGRRLPTRDLIYDVLGEAAMPLPLQNVTKKLSGFSQEQNYGDLALRTAGAQVQTYKTEAQQKAAELSADRSESGPIDTDKLRAHAVKLETEDRLRSGTMRPEELYDAVDQGIMGPKDAKAIMKNVQETQGMDAEKAKLYTRASHLPMSDFLLTWDLATAGEKTALTRLMLKKKQSYFKKVFTEMTPEQRRTDPTYQKLRRLFPDQAPF